LATSITVSDHELSEIRGLIESRSGILFDNSRERFFSTRVREHVEARKLSHGTDLIRLIQNSNVEYDSLLQRLLTQETAFFRYPSVFDALEKKVLPELQTRKFWENPRSLRIWSAGCATGEEAYSIAMTVADAIEFADAWKVHLLATDVSRQALEYAEKAVYDSRDMGPVSPHHREQYFSRAGNRFTVTAIAEHGYVCTHEPGPGRVHGQVRLHLLHECADLFFRRAAGAVGAALL